MFGVFHTLCSQLMAKCWHENPHVRPSFQQILLTLADPRILDPPTVALTPLTSLKHSISLRQRSFMSLLDLDKSQRKQLRTMASGSGGSPAGSNSGSPGAGTAGRKGGGSGNKNRVRLSHVNSAPIDSTESSMHRRYACRMVRHLFAFAFTICVLWACLGAVCAPYACCVCACARACS